MIKSIKKFKYSESKLQCEVIYFDDKENEISIKSSDEPLDDLIRIMDALGNFVTEICELPENNVITVTGITLSNSHDIRGACIIAQMSLSKSTGIVNLVTPHRIPCFYGEHGDEG